MKRLLQFMTIGLILPLILSCGKDSDEDSQESLYSVDASDIEWTMENPISWGGSNNGATVVYTFIGFSHTGTVTTDKDKRSFEYTFNNSVVRAIYSDGGEEIITIKKNVPGVPTASDKVYFNGNEFHRFSY